MHVLGDHFIYFRPYRRKTSFTPTKQLRHKMLSLEFFFLTYQTYERTRTHSLIYDYY